MLANECGRHDCTLIVAATSRCVGSCRVWLDVAGASMDVVTTTYHHTGAIDHHVVPAQRHLGWAMRNRRAGQARSGLR